MNDQHNPVTQVLEAYKAAVHAKDVDAFMAIYSPDVHAFDTWGQWEYAGAEAWRTMATDWFHGLGDDQVEVTFSEVQTVVGDEVAFGYAAVTFARISASGERLRAMTNRGTFCLAKQDGAWKIVHEHTSLPIEMKTGKGIFSR